MRLFVAIDFDELKEDIAKLQKSIDPSSAKLKEVSTFHLTLKFLGKVAEDKVNTIIEKLKQIKFPPFILTLSRIGVFPAENYIRVIWVDVKPQEEAAKLHKKVEDALKEFNFKKDFGFFPHVTLARVKSVNDREKFIKRIKELKTENKAMEVKSFKLIKSTLTQQGPIYEDISVFPLS